MKDILVTVDGLYHVLYENDRIFMEIKFWHIVEPNVIRYQTPAVIGISFNFYIACIFRSFNITMCIHRLVLDGRI